MIGARLQPLALYITTMGMELCCLYLATLWVMEKFSLGYIAFALILTIYPITLFLSLLILKSTSRPGGSQWPTILIGITVTALVAGLSIWGSAASQPAISQQDVRGFGFQIGLIAITWWLGFSLARSGTNYQNICFRFQLGILALLVLSMFTGQVFLPVVAFFTLAILTLILTRWENSVSTSRAILKPLPLGNIVLGCLVILLPVIGLFFTLSDGVADNIVGWMSGIGDSIDSFLKSGLPSDNDQTSRLQPSCSCSSWTPEETILIPETTPPDSSGVASTASPWLVFLIIGLCSLAGILAIILLTIRKRKAKRHLTYPETAVGIETTIVSTSLLNEFAAFFKGIFMWLCQLILSLFKLRSDTSPMRAHMGEPGLSVRALYCHLLSWAASRGLPRIQSQTPLEYLKELCQKFPGRDKELAFITEVYLQARYSLRPVSNADAEAVGQAWQTIQNYP